LPGFRSFLIAALVLPAASMRPASRLRPFQPKCAPPLHSYRRRRTAAGGHAAASYEFVNFDITGPVDVAITPLSPVSGMPGRYSALAPGPASGARRPDHRFRLAAPPSSHLPPATSQPRSMLFLFAGSPPPPRPPAQRHIVPPDCIARASIQKRRHIYLAPALSSSAASISSTWTTSSPRPRNHRLRRPQDPKATRAGWKARLHCIVAYQSHNIEIDGVTCIIRSRTWSIQMTETANSSTTISALSAQSRQRQQDGMDWLGAGDTTVRNSFCAPPTTISPWKATGTATPRRHASTRPRRSEHRRRAQELSTSISNTVRIGWPQKSSTPATSPCATQTSSRRHRRLRPDLRPARLLGRKGLERRPHQPELRESPARQLVFAGANRAGAAQHPRRQLPQHLALGQPPLDESTLTGDVSGVTFDNLKYGQTAWIPPPPSPAGLGRRSPAAICNRAFSTASFAADPPVFALANRSSSRAGLAAGALHLALRRWTIAHGRSVRHAFPDAEGTEFDGANGAGRFRVLLHVEDKEGKQDWAEQDLVAVDRWHPETSYAALPSPPRFQNLSRRMD